uniref:Uncharacterized protein n=1 Tax=Cacopsylla melanoneura TaxID=428564 RepID=A0A8D8TJ03_9HEMI
MYVQNYICVINNINVLISKVGISRGRVSFTNMGKRVGATLHLFLRFFQLSFQKSMGFSLNFRKKNCSYDFNNRGHQISTSVVRYFMYNGQLQEFSNFSDRKVNA